MNQHRDDVEEAHRALDELNVPRMADGNWKMSLASRIQWLVDKRHGDM
jgi:hypothetical protein